MFGFTESPTAVLYGKPYTTASGDTITVNGETTFVIPLLGDQVADVKTGLAGSIETLTKGAWIRHVYPHNPQLGDEPYAYGRNHWSNHGK